MFLVGLECLFPTDHQRAIIYRNFPMTNPPEIETARLKLRVFDVAGDLDPIAAALANPEVVQFLPGGQPKTRDEARVILQYSVSHWQTHGFGWWAVTHRTDDRVLGWCGLNQLKDVDEVEVLYLFDRPEWAKGFATEAALAVVRYGFERLRLDHIVGLIHPKNIPSRRVLEKIGLTFRGRERHFNMDVESFEVWRSSFVPDRSHYRVSD